MKSNYQIEIDDILEEFNTSLEKGLGDQTASKMLEIFGENTVQQQESRSGLELLWHNINNLIVYLLLAAATLSFSMGETIEGIAVLIAVILAVLTGFFTEFRAQKSIDSLQEMIFTTTKVIREGRVLEIPSQKIVPGDILLLEEGDAIAADARLINCKNFACIESALTGESEAVEKDCFETYKNDIPLGDRKNVVFAGTAVTRGKAYAVATETGMCTEVGKISAMLTGDKRQKTPLDIELDKLGKAIIIAAFFAGITVLIAGILTEKPFIDMLHISIILAVAAIPEAMPAVSTITLSHGMKIMAEHKALVKTLSAVETLGATSVIASDKTGTLTENQMTVSSITLADGQKVKVTGSGYEPFGAFFYDEKEFAVNECDPFYEFIRNGVLCTTAALIKNKDSYEIIGDPTDGAFVVLGEKIKLSRRKLSEQGWRQVAELPFDSENKFMISVYEKEERVLVIKGAPDVLLNLVKKSNSNNEKLLEFNNELAETGRRVIALGKIDNYQGGLSDEELIHALKDIEIQGFVGIVDPPRLDVKKAVNIAQEAGIEVKMITGDHPKTASMIAKDIGIKAFEKTMTGQEIDDLVKSSDFCEIIKDISVFARVSPENKLQLVRTLREGGHIVSMTGDGVNDAPALNGANIGIAMGIRGTEVAKESSDMILTDDCFCTIIEAIKEGRIIFDNIKKYVAFLFSCNMVEIVTIFLSVIFLLPIPIQPMHILYLNLVIDIAPAMALAFEIAEEDIMKRKPRSSLDSLVNKNFLWKIILSGVVLGTVAFGLYIYISSSEATYAYAQTVTFTFMAIAQLMHIFNVRRNEGFGLDATVLKNRPLIVALLISVFLLLIAIYLPFMNELIGTVPIGVSTWGIILLSALFSTMIVTRIKKLF
ncbi:cation-translocating P-type ATPase [Enterococcus raffinosus]|uniref:HAD-IC family P-type ATPase n=1 Tax=Enterococcus raffinosus TaxID=71452 RepID=A0AAW8TB64_9ENTE|nr:HAD-IC family P-type ATPase [Enterococcus raffinosus]MDT2521721.1 HAD-IC family P-type ATPase [Enterococcus raffinosus]MDT2531992.1 HAD-IC family P-type ATPase [Enterococcus raffinosus]MDT2532764.1 HAD-IC family P-type ATPase [Enterococcus raffinosus]MDT2545517.1 HAD-IC family P-type ATPase [Enterococcus raffinosus]MDT2554659.1 HAD-IC family P-type ATPase [Enterococcus raffinosus]